MLKIALCEDSRLQRENIKEYISKIFEENNVEYELLEYKSGEELIDKYPDNIDILLLDIQMDKLNGMDTARKIREFDQRVEIIFTTALWDYIQKGYEVRAYRYLIKPIEYEDFKSQINSCIADIITKAKNYLVINTKNNVSRIPISTILYIETKIGKRELIVYTKNGIEHIKTTMSKLEKELERYNFIRCHSGYLVNLNEIESLSQNIITINGEEVPVSKRKIKEVKENLTNLLGDVLC